MFGWLKKLFTPKHERTYNKVPEREYVHKKEKTIRPVAQYESAETSNNHLTMDEIKQQVGKNQARIDQHSIKNAHRVPIFEHKTPNEVRAEIGLPPHPPEPKLMIYSIWNSIKEQMEYCLKKGDKEESFIITRTDMMSLDKLRDIDRLVAARFREACRKLDISDEEMIEVAQQFQDQLKYGGRL